MLNGQVEERQRLVRVAVEQGLDVPAIMDRLAAKLVAAARVRNYTMVG